MYFITLQNNLFFKIVKREIIYTDTTMNNYIFIYFTNSTYMSSNDEYLNGLYFLLNSLCNIGFFIHILG